MANPPNNWVDMAVMHVVGQEEETLVAMHLQSAFDFHRKNTYSAGSHLAMIKETHTEPLGWPQSSSPRTLRQHGQQQRTWLGTLQLRGQATGLLSKHIFLKMMNSGPS